MNIFSVTADNHFFLFLGCIFIFQFEEGIYEAGYPEVDDSLGVVARDVDGRFLGVGFCVREPALLIAPGTP